MDSLSKAGVAAVLLLCSACDPGAGTGTGSPLPPAADGVLRLVVSVPPQAAFVRRIAGSRAGEGGVQVEVFVGAGQDPHHFTATPRQVMQLASTRAYFTIGMPFEEVLVKKISAAVPSLRIYDMAEGLEPVEAIGGEHNGHGHEHAHPGKEEEGEEDHRDHHGHDHSYDPHIWLSPPLIAGIARNIHDALVELDPSNASHYSENLQSFEEELESLDEELAFTLEPCRGSSFFVYHPAFTHFAARYGLRQKAIEFEGKSPTPKKLMALVEEARASNARVIFTQPQYDASSARTVAEAIDGTVESIDPLAEDVLSNLRQIALTLYEALEQ